MNLRQDALTIINKSIQTVLPNEAVKKALVDKTFSDGKRIIVAIGKASYEMAKAALEVLDRVDDGVVICKYKHIKSDLKPLMCFEAGHPVPDENTFKATKYALDLTSNLNSNDTVIFLVSGGGSALFEDPLIEYSKLRDITNQLLKSSANIEEINTIRKHLSKVKGGKFALHCKPANIYSIVLSDVIDDKLDVIASGPAYPDSSTSEQAIDIINKYNIELSKEVFDCLKIETVKQLDNVETVITGSVTQLCESAKNFATQLGYETFILKTNETGQANLVGAKFAKKALEVYENYNKATCLIIGGETVVQVKGNGLGGRNQELALAASKYIKDKDILIASVGSDGTDGPTDAAGGIVDKNTVNDLEKLNIDVDQVLNNNDSYNALKLIDGLVMTGPTGTNVNDVAIALIKKSN